LVCCLCWLASTGLAQTRWYGGGAWRSSHRSERISGSVGLQAVPDREWMIGFDRRTRMTGLAIDWGCLSTLRLHSPFYELDHSLPYYPIKSHLPTHRFESVQVFSFIGIERALMGSERIHSVFRLGPVFSVHGGNFLSTTTAWSVTDQRSFILYRLGVRPHPLGIPFWRLQGGVCVKWGERRRLAGSVQLVMSYDIGDRSQVMYQTVPQDAIHVSEGWLRKQRCSFGLLCGLGKKR